MLLVELTQVNSPLNAKLFCPAIVYVILVFGKYVCVGILNVTLYNPPPALTELAKLKMFVVGTKSADSSTGPICIPSTTASR